MVLQLEYMSESLNKNNEINKRENKLILQEALKNAKLAVEYDKKNDIKNTLKFVQVDQEVIVILKYKNNLSLYFLNYNNVYLNFLNFYSIIILYFLTNLNNLKMDYNYLYIHLF